MFWTVTETFWLWKLNYKETKKKIVVPALLLCFYKQFKIKILTFKHKNYSPIDNYRRLNIVCEVGVSKGYFGFVGVGGYFLWVGGGGRSRMTVCCDCGGWVEVYFRWVGVVVCFAWMGWSILVGWGVMGVSRGGHISYLLEKLLNLILCLPYFPLKLLKASTCFKP